jgi:tetratricopeptide (TPR) repeat protein
VVGYFAQSLLLFPVAEIDAVAWLLAGVVAVGVAVRQDVITLHPPRIAKFAVAGGAVAALVWGALDVVADRSARDTLAALRRPSAMPERAAGLRPDAIRYRIVAARWYEALDTLAGLDAAARELDVALDVSPKDPVLRRGRARILLERARRTGSTREIDRARAALGQLARDDPVNAEVQLRLGLALALGGDVTQAERAWLRAEDLAPRSAAASTNLAIAYAQQGRPTLARAAAKRALARDPSEDRARKVLENLDGT